MSTDDDFTAYVGTHWSSLIRAALLLGCDAERAEPAVVQALVRSYSRWARAWEDDRADEEVLTQLLVGVYEPTGRVWRGEKAEPGQHADAPDDDPTVGDGTPTLAQTFGPLLPLHRDVLVLRHVAELDDAQAADVLDVPLDTVQGRRERALSAVRHVAGGSPLSEQRLTAMVEQHRQDQPMSLPPADLLTVARAERRRRGRHASVVSAGVLAGLVAVSGAVHLVSSLGDGSPAVAASTVPAPAPPWARHPSGPTPTTRLVGLNGWALRVPAFWGTDPVACDGVTPARPTVLFTSLLAPGPHCATDHPTLFVRIGDQDFHGVPWRTISGVPVLRRPHPCAVCATLRVPSARVSFQIRAATSTQLHRIARSLVPLSPRQVNLPIGSSTRGRSALDRMVTITTAEGLRPRVIDVPSRRPPGTFLGSEPPIGTPVDLGRSVSLFFSAGDLDRYATTASLQRHGWRILGVAEARPTYSRPTAVRAALGRGATPSGHPTFLRTLTITHEGPRRVVVRRRLVWLVVTANPSATRPGAASITAVDATTDRVIERQPAFRGRVRMSIR